MGGTNQTITGLTILGSTASAIENQGGGNGTLTIQIANGQSSSSASNFSFRDQSGGNGTLALVKTGEGTLDFSAYNTMGYSGGLTVNGGTFAYTNTMALGSGTLVLGGGSPSYAGSSAVTVSKNITLSDATSSTLNNAAGTLTYSGVISGSGSLIKSGAGNATLSGANTFTGSTTLNGGTLTLANQNAIQNSTLVMTGGGNVSFSSAVVANAFTLGGLSASSAGSGCNIALTNNASTPVALTVGTNNASTTYAGVLSGSGSLTKTGTGTLTLSGNNIFAGTTTISEGMISISNANALGTTGNITFGSGTLRYGTGITADLSSRIKNSGSAILIDTNSNNVTFSSAVYSTNIGGLTQTGSGILTLSGNSTYTGTTTLAAGTISINRAAALGTSGNVTFGGGALQYGTGITADLSSRIKNSASTILIDTNSNNVTFSSTVDSINVGGLTKTGSGILKLSGNSTFTGSTTVSSGTLQAAATGALGNTSQVVLNNGGSFLVTAENAVNDDAAINLNGGRMAMSGNFNETVGALTLSANSTLDFSGFVGTLRFGSIAYWAAGANLAIWNWSGQTQYGINYGTYPNNSNLVFTNNSTLSSNLANISFYSDSGITSIGSGFERGFTGGGTEIIAVPETETYLYAVALLAGIVVQYIRRRAKRKSSEQYLPEFATRATAPPRSFARVGKPRRRGPTYAARPPLHPEETPLRG